MSCGRCVCIGVTCLLVVGLVGQGCDGWLRKVKHPHITVNEKSDTVYGDDVPVLRMLKRQLRGFRSGRRASLTLVFHSTLSLHIRWFRQPHKAKLFHSEIENMIPIAENDPQYRMSFLMSGDVTAATLSIPRITVSFPVRYETVLTSEDGLMQYQITTVVKKTTDHAIHVIDSPEWLAIPQHRWQFRTDRRIQVYCSAIVTHEDMAYTNQLSMFHALPITEYHVVSTTRTEHHQQPIKNYAKLEYRPVMSIHRDTSNYAEENGATLLQARRVAMQGQSAKYELMVSSSNATQAMEGIYVCSLERKQDKLYVTAALTLYGNPSPLPRMPQVDFVSCEKSNYEPRNRTLYLTRGQETCIRCRGIGYPRPTVGVYQNDLELVTNGHLTVSKYVNVADGGVSEVSYVLKNHQALTAASYLCRAHNDKGSTNIYFTVVYR